MTVTGNAYQHQRSVVVVSLITGGQGGKRIDGLGYEVLRPSPPSGVQYTNRLTLVSVRSTEYVVLTKSSDHSPVLVQRKVQPVTAVALGRRSALVHLGRD